MAGNDWIPSSDSEFNAFFIQFNNWVQANGLTHGLTAGQVTAMQRCVWGLGAGV